MHCFKSGSLWLESEYSRPKTLNDLHPDLEFTANDSAGLPFLNTKSSIAANRKRKQSISSEAANIYFWSDPSLDECRALFKQWSRPQLKPPPVDGGKEGLEIFVVDCVESVASYESTDCSHIKTLLPNKIPRHQNHSVVMIFGHTLTDDSSICLRVWGFQAYVCIECPQDLLKRHQESACCSELEKFLDERLSTQKEYVKKVISVELVDGESLMDYNPGKTNQFFKVRLSTPRLVSACRTQVENGIQLFGQYLPNTPYEAGVPHSLRWMIDSDIVGCGCIRIEEYQAVAAHWRISRCQRELDVWFDNVHALPLEGKYEKIPSELRVVALDIECMTVASEGFPIPEKDHVIQISSILTCPGRDEPIVKTIFTWNTCAPIAGAMVFSFADERAMLSVWREFVIYTDPDILTGFNFINFDLNFLVRRSQVLDIPNFRNLGRVINSETKIRDAVLSTKALGTHENKDINIEGRIQFDALELIRRDYKLKSYSLNAVSAHFLKEQKEDVHYKQIRHLQMGTAETRKRIATYCIKDSWLVIRLLASLCFLVNYIEMARVTGVPINMLLTRGQQIKVTSQLLRKCKEWKMMMPTIRPQGGSADVQYEGATVLEPMKDFYDIPIATLDFASLYPSIMIAHNLCYSTLIEEEQIKSLKLAPDDYFKTPANKYFVKPNLKKGILPTIVSDLLSARKKAKKEMALAEDAFMKMVLDGRQLALKISANSVYGYTGAAATGQLPCLAVSESITAYGRTMIDFTKTKVEEKFKRANGYENDAVVVYGDTDSVMVKFGCSEISEAMRLGREAAEFVSAQFLKPISLEFEKVFSPFLLMNKKRYAGLMWTKPDKFQKIDCKGIETVRRDFCLLVQQMVDDALKALLIRRDPAGAMEMTKKRIQDLLMNRVDMSYLVLSKSLGREDYAAKMAHVELAKKLRKRDPATAPQIGDRVYYVIVAGAKGQPQSERAEDPLYALENNLPIDVDFYLDSIKNPIMRIFEPIGEKSAASLFTGEHTLRKKVMMSTSGALSSFVKAGLRCLACRGAIKAGAFCDHCKKEDSRIQNVVLEKMTDFSAKEDEFHSLWVECQRCQESLHQDVICTSRDCPIFYRRMKVKKELHDMHNSVILRLHQDDW